MFIILWTILYVLIIFVCINLNFIYQIMYLKTQHSMMYTRNWHYRNVNEHYLMSCICEQWEINFHIVMSYQIGLLLSIKKFFLKRTIAFSDVLLRAKQIINAEILNTNYFRMGGYIEISYSANILKIITIYSGFYIEFASIYYNDEWPVFRYILGKYIKPSIKDINHPVVPE